MEGYFKNKYRIDSTRLKKYNYASPGAYFITICTKNKYYYFGEVVNNKMRYSCIGNIAKDYFLRINLKYNFAIIDEWIIMPNHVHLIIMINNAQSWQRRASGASHEIGSQEMGKGKRRAAGASVPEYDKKDNRQIMNINAQEGRRADGASVQEINIRKFGPLQRKSISLIVNHLKGQIKKLVDKNNINDFYWQERYHDIIIHNQQQLNNIRQYIINNPKKWKK